MNPAEFYEKRKGTLAGGALGIVLAVTFLGQSWREAQRFQLDPSDPAYRVCLDLTPDECVAKVANDPRVQTPESRTLDSTETANRIGARQRRARTTTTTRSTSSPSQSPSSTGGSSSPPTAPTPTRPTPSPSRTPSRPPSTTSRPAPTPSRPPSTPPPSSRPAPSPPSSPTPTPSAPSAPSPPAPSVPPPPNQPTVPPPINVPLPPVPAQICTPFVGVNCPNGSVQAQRITGKGPGSIDDPVRPGERPSQYDVDPSTPSDNVNTVPNRGNSGEGSP